MEVFVVDAFTDKPFSGNPAAVCIVRGQQLTEDKMQAIAVEMKHSETAFVCPEGDSTHERATLFNLRWFTPKCEVPLCGHGTLGTAATIFNALANPNNQLEFKSKSGLLKASRDGEYITIDLPIATSCPQESSPVQELIKHTVGELPVSDVRYSATRSKLLVRLADSVGRKELEQMNPNVAAMLRVPNQLENGEAKGVIVTIKGSEGEYDFLSRYFAPWIGIPEDPVTGAAHTVLASYWSGQLGGKSVLMARQCSPRGGDIKVTVGEGEDEGRVFLTGRTCIILKGHLINI